MINYLIEVLISSFPSFIQKKIVSKRIHLSEQPQRPFKESDRLYWKYFNQQPNAWELGLCGSAGKCLLLGRSPPGEGGFLISATMRHKGHRAWGSDTSISSPTCFLCNTSTQSPSPTASSKLVPWRSPMTSLLLIQMAFSSTRFSSSSIVYCLSK